MGQIQPSATRRTFDRFAREEQSFGGDGESKPRVHGLVRSLRVATWSCATRLL